MCALFVLFHHAAVQPLFFFVKQHCEIFHLRMLMSVPLTTANLVSNLQL